METPTPLIPLRKKGCRCCFALSKDFLLTAKRDAQAAKRFFHKALNAVYTQEPRVINVDKNAAYSQAIDELKKKEELSLQVELQQNNYLNNIVEQGQWF